MRFTDGQLKSLARAYAWLGKPRAVALGSLFNFSGEIVGLHEAFTRWHQDGESLPVSDEELPVLWALKRAWRLNFPITQSEWGRDYWSGVTWINTIGQFPAMVDDPAGPFYYPGEIMEARDWKEKLERKLFDLLRKNPLRPLRVRVCRSFIEARGFLPKKPEVLQ